MDNAPITLNTVIDRILITVAVCGWIVLFGPFLDSFLKAVIS